VWTCRWAVHYPWDRFILSTIDRGFNCACIVSACRFTSCSCNSSAFNSGFSVSRSYAWALKSLNCLHSRVRNFILSTALQAIASLWSLTFCGVLGTVKSSKFVSHCCSCWITSVSFSTWCVTQSFSCGSNPVTEWRDLLTTSFTSSCSARNFSFSCCIYSFSYSNFS
jgi:hypothetical protein